MPIRSGLSALATPGEIAREMSHAANHIESARPARARARLRGIESLMPISPALLREYASINRQRKSEGITPLEYQRWLDLTSRLEKAFPGRCAPGSSGTTRIRIEFATVYSLRESAMTNLQPVGMFVGTPFAPDPGVRFELHTCVQETGESFTSSVVVASTNVGPGFSTQFLGMGLRFSPADCALRRKLESLCGIKQSPVKRRPTQANEQQPDG